jgi:hypothetical protein
MRGGMVLLCGRGGIKATWQEDNLEVQCEFLDIDEVNNFRKMLNGISEH